MNFLHIVLLLVIFACAAMALWFRNVFHSIIALAVFSLLLALEFYLLQAPDAAIVEIGTGAITAAIALITFFACRRKNVNKEEQR